MYLIASSPPPPYHRANAPIELSRGRARKICKHYFHSSLPKKKNSQRLCEKILKFTRTPQPILHNTSRITTKKKKSTKSQRATSTRKAAARMPVACVKLRAHVCYFNKYADANTHVYFTYISQI